MSLGARKLLRGSVRDSVQPEREFFDYPAAAWPQSTTQGGGRYSVLWDGGGAVQITSDHTLQLESSSNPVADGWGDTASSLVVSTNSVGDFDETVRLKTIAQLRNEAVPAGSRGAPYPWEVAWFAWHFVTSGADTAFYYVALKPNGFEMGKVDQRLRDGGGNFLLPGGQRFLWTTGTAYPIGVWYGLRVRQVGAVIDIWVDGQHIITFTDGPGSGGSPAWGTAGETVLTNGAWGYYHEDARVAFDDGPYVVV